MHKTFWAVPLTLLLLCACGDDDDGGARDASSRMDSGGDAGTDATSDAGADTGTEDARVDAGADASVSPTCGAATRAYVTTSAFVDGMAQSGVVDLASHEVHVGAAASPDQDHVPVRAGCRVLELQRAKNVVELRSQADPLVVERSWNVGVGGQAGYENGNPQSVAWIGDTKLYVALLARDELVVLDPTRDGVAGVVDLAPLALAADTDGHVDATAVVGSGLLAYVLLGRVVVGFPVGIVGPSLLAVVDTRTDALVDVDATIPGVQGIELAVANPVGMLLDAARHRLLVAGAGVYGTRDGGGVEAIDLDAQRSDGLVVTETDVGADVSAVVGDAELAFVVSNDDAFATHVHRFGLATSRLGEEIPIAGTPAVVAARDELWVGMADGVHVFRASTSDELTTMPITVGDYAPYGMVAIP